MEKNTKTTLYEVFNRSVEKFAERTAFSLFGGETLTYAEVGRRVAQVQESLKTAGLKAGDKVVLLSSNMPNWASATSPLPLLALWQFQSSRTLPARSWI